MKQRLADYIADFLVEHGITDCFTVVGGVQLGALGFIGEYIMNMNHRLINRPLVI